MTSCLTLAPPVPRLRDLLKTRCQLKSNPGDRIGRYREVGTIGGIGNLSLFGFVAAFKEQGSGGHVAPQSLSPQCHLLASVSTLSAIRLVRYLQSTVQSLVRGIGSFANDGPCLERMSHSVPLPLGFKPDHTSSHLVILESLQNIHGLVDNINPADERAFALYCFFAIQVCLRFSLYHFKQSNLSMLEY
jgi:hypothetical protein